MIFAVKATINKYRLIQSNDTVIAALSGGADSVAMLYCLRELSSELGFTLRAAHLNHNLRGDEALRDEKYCQSLCERLSIPLDAASIDVAQIAENEKISLELAGRNARYSFFDALAKNYSNAKIATAHTSSDNIETIIYNIVRGTGIGGVCGIPPVRGNIIRPLIECTGEQTRAFCEKMNLDFVTDSTNAELDYNRNRIRNLSIPPLREINPALEKNFLRFSENMREIDRFLEFQTAEALSQARLDYGYSCKIILSKHNALQGRIISEAAKAAGARQLEKKHIDLCREILKNGGAVCLPDGLRAVSGSGVFRIIPADDENGCSVLPLTADSDCRFLLSDKRGCKECRLEFSSKPEKGLIPLFGDAVVTVRTRSAGDTLYFPQRGIHKTLKKLFNEAAVPTELRASMLVFENDNSIIYTEYFKDCASEKAYTDGRDKKPKSFLKISISYHKSGL